MPLAPPPDGASFPTWEECFRAVQSHAAAEGYAVNAKGQAKSRDTGLYRRYVIRCDKSGTFKSAAQLGTRRISTKKTDCPFSAACNIRADGCYLRVLKPEHNHPPSSVPAAHVQHRKLTDEQRRLVETRAVERKSIKVIWEELKSIDPNTYITFKDVDNAVQRFRKKAKDGATGIQAIIYKLVERQDLFCYTLEREGAVQGAFWVPRWTTDLWMRPNGTPDILVMLSEHVANRPLLPILEMNSVLNAAHLGPPQQTRAVALVPGVSAGPNTTSSDNPAPDNPGNGEGPAPNLAPRASEQNAQQVPAANTYGSDACLGTGYAILPDKSDATILWLRSSVEMFRQRIPQCPKPRFITLTDFQTSEKNILVEVSKGGARHRQMHIVLGRILTSDEENQAHHGVKTRKPRVERVIGHAADTTMEQNGEAGDENDENDDEDGEEADGDGEQEGEGEEDDDDQDQDMDGDHDSDAEIARQLTSANVQGPSQDRQNVYSTPSQNPSQSYSFTPQRAPEHLQYYLQNPIPGPNALPSRLPLPPPGPRQPPAQGQAPAPYRVSGSMMPGSGTL
ncbi:hypothetical protein ONZ43_g1482 [Nemania bipapillata]|uniref:Uncharacterized protein n=1 Tax=Nemania bipapillata TaxID=110536 RepID=A0ACC2J4P2_9PEZI|nr:hypothetical protein ONZ43_g1482 [Nemania bipapillata]